MSIALTVLSENALSPEARALTTAVNRLRRRGLRRIALWGAGAHTRKCVAALPSLAPPIVCLIDDVATGELAGLPIVSRDEALSRGIEAVVCSSDQWEDKMWAERGSFTAHGIDVVRLYPPGLARRMSLIIEIAGLCNARCTYCPTGNGEKKPAAFMPVELFRRIFDHLDGMQLLRSPIIPYNFGEPLIHPRINDILAHIRARGHHARISTNLMHLPRLTADAFTALSLIEISLSGMTQDSYAIGHGGHLRQTLANIDKLVALRDAAGAATALRMRWHRYRFNEDEMSDAQAFCDQRGIEFMPYFAHVNDLTRVKSYFDATLPRESRARMHEHLFTSHMEQVVELFGRTEPLDCPQFHDLTIDEEGYVLPCCAVHGQVPGARLGHVLDLGAEHLRTIKRSWDFCDTCMRRGWSGYVNSYLQPAEMGVPDEEFGATAWGEPDPDCDTPFADLAARLVAVPPNTRIAVWGVDTFTRTHFGRLLNTIARKHLLVGFIDETGGPDESLHGLAITRPNGWRELRPGAILIAGHPSSARRLTQQARAEADRVPLIRLHGQPVAAAPSCSLSE